LATRFPRTARLSRPSEFKKVFATGKKQSDACFTLLSMPNAHGGARLGLVLPKRHEPRAVDRNRLKRVVRECFRQSRRSLPPLDVIVMLRGSLRFKSNPQLRDSLTQHWQRLQNQCAIR
jgi:ribonuclease P protein component